jgi:hypothetical protein
LANCAEEAFAALGSISKDNVIAGFDETDEFANFFNNARTFVAQYEWQLQADGAVDDGQVTVTYTTGSHFDADFILADAVEFDFFNGDLIDAIYDYGFHCIPPDRFIRMMAAHIGAKFPELCQWEYQ